MSMRRVFRLIGLFICALVAVAATVIVIFFLQPGWQEEVVDGVLEKDENRQWDFGSVELRPGGVRLTDLFVLDHFGGIQTSKVDLDITWTALLGKRLQIPSGKLEKVFIDLSGMPLDQVTRGELMQAREDPRRMLDWMASRSEDWLRREPLGGFELEAKDIQVEAMLLFEEDLRIPVNFVIEDLRRGEEAVEVRLSEGLPAAVSTK